MIFEIGSLVRRMEEASGYGEAVVLNISPRGETFDLELQYLEGGSGWWPIDCVEEVPDPGVDSATGM